MPLRIIKYTPSLSQSIRNNLLNLFFSWKQVWLLTTLALLGPLIFFTGKYAVEELARFGGESGWLNYMFWLLCGILGLAGFHGLLMLCTLYCKCAARSPLTHALTLLLPLGYLSALLYALWPIQNPQIYAQLLEYSVAMWMAAGIWVWLLRCPGDYEGPFWFLRMVGPCPETLIEAEERKIQQQIESSMRE